jgi:phosphatidylinositol-3-phosphatase
VRVIELENQGYAQSFGTPSADPHLATTLPQMGALLENYYAIGHSSAANYVAQVSGQAPDIATHSDCPLWAPFAGRVIPGPCHQVPGDGCVRPAVQTLGNQLSAAGRSWAAYLQDMGSDPARDTTARGPACGHPATWAIDHTQKPPTAISTPPATTGARSSAPSPAARPGATRTSCRPGRCPAT